MTFNAVNINPIMFRGSQGVKKAQKSSNYAKPEFFEGEKEALLKIYNQYMDNMKSQSGGYQKIDGQLVHVHTVYHSDSEMQHFIVGVRKRLEELGALKPNAIYNPQIIY